MNPGQFQIGDSIGTLFLSLFPCVLLLFPFSRILWFLLVMAGCSAALLYFLVLPEARYYIGVLLLLCPVLATAIQEIEKRKIVQIAVTTVVIVNCVFSLMVSIRILGPSMKAMASPKAAERMKRDHIPFYEAFDYLRRNNITDIVVFSAPQNLYYLPKQTRYRIDASLLSHGETLPGSYVLDIDRSQTLERNFALMKGDYLIPPQALPKNVTLVFQGPDARIYHFF